MFNFPQDVPPAESEQNAIGGALFSGGQLSSGVMGANSRTRRPRTGAGHQMYHDLIHMKPAQWHQIREGAHQLLGHQPSPMWGPMHVQGLANSHNAMRDITNLPSASAAARQVESEGREGGQFTRAVAHLSNATKRMR